MARPKKNQQTTVSNLGFEATLRATVDKLRNTMDGAEYKHVVPGLLFLKYLSDAFEEPSQKLSKEKGSDPEDPDEYRAENVFWVPKEACWSYLQATAKNPKIGVIVDEALTALEQANRDDKNHIPFSVEKNYARPSLDKERLGEVIDLIAKTGLGDAENRSKEIIGGVYEYFLSEFASAEGKNGGQFYTPRCVVQTLVAMISPFKGRVFDPCCGSGGMFVRSEKFVETHGGRIGDISIYGRESKPTTWKLAKMNLAIRGIDHDLGDEHADSFKRDLHPSLKADYILANPPFNMKDWGGENLKDDVRWKYGIPQNGNANYAWIQHFIHHLSPSGIAGFVLANGSMSSNQSGEGEIRKNLLEADLVDCMVALPGQLFYSTQIPACLWFVARNRSNGKFRDRRREILFIDARKMGIMRDRTHRELTDEDVEKIAGTYHAWRGDKDTGIYENIPGFCASATLEEVAKHGYVLTPGRYVGAEEAEDDGEPFSEKMARLTKQLSEQMKEGEQLDTEIRKNLAGLGFQI